MRDVLEKFLATHKNFVIDPVSCEGLPPAIDGMDFDISSARSYGWILYGSYETPIII